MPKLKKKNSVKPINRKISRLQMAEINLIKTRWDLNSVRVTLETWSNKAKIVTIIIVIITQKSITVIVVIMIIIRILILAIVLKVMIVIIFC